MNRCRFLQTACAAGLLALTAATGVQAQQSLRVFNDKTQRGTLELLNPPYVRLNGVQTRLSPGSRLFNEENRIVMASGYAGKKLIVQYLVDNMGQVGDVWILTAQERANVTPGEQSRMKAKAAGANFKYEGPAFQPGKPYSEQHQFRNEY